MKVDAAAVDRELARLQRELTSSEVRTSLFNLVVMSPDVERTMVDEALTYILGKRAARVIHIVNSDQAESALEVSARCSIDYERKGVCFEEVVITNGRDGAGGAPGSWTPLLIRDIPTFVFWMDTLAGKEELFLHAQNQSAKVIVDGDLSVRLGDDPDAFIAGVAGFAASGGPLIDFSWKRLLPVRKLLADAFAGDRVALLNEIKSVSVEGLDEIAGRLLGLWFAERLGWKPLPGAPHGTTFTDIQGREVTVDARPQADCAVAAAVQLFSQDSISVTAGVNGCADIEYPEGSAHPIVALPSNGEILLEEVDTVSADNLFRSALTRL